MLFFLTHQHRGCRPEPHFCWFVLLFLSQSANMDTPRRFRLFRAPTTTRDKENSGIKSTTAITTGKHGCFFISYLFIYFSFLMQCEWYKWGYANPSTEKLKHNVIRRAAGSPRARIRVGFSCMEIYNRYSVFNARVPFLTRSCRCQGGGSRAAHQLIVKRQRCSSAAL